MRRGAGAGIAAVTAVLAFAGSAWASPFIHAHRGGAVVRGAPTYGENTIRAFRAAAKAGFVLEADVKLTADRRPVVIHDATLDRTTTCTGEVRSRTLSQLRECRIDVLGSGTVTRPDVSASDRVPPLEDLLKLAREHGARLNLEIKNIPTDPDFEASPDFARTVLDAIDAAGLPRDRVIVQSFWPPNLDEAEARGYDTSLLTLAQLNDGAPEFAKARGYEWISTADAKGLVPGLVSRAHALGLRVVPYTLNTPASIAAATLAGADEIITDDPHTARDAVAAAFPARPAIPPPPQPAECAAARAASSLPTVTAFDDGAGPRVFAMQFKQESRHVVDYAAFRTKIECMVRERVLPHLARGRPNVVAFNEDVGLATIATGTRGLAAREAFATPGRTPSCEPEGVPCGTLAALAAVRAGYSRELAAYRARFPSMSAIADSFVAPTDTFGRGWMQVFSDMARRYGVYILGSNNQPRFRESIDPAEIAAFADPDLPAPPSSVFVATGAEAYNEVFLWAPADARREGPWPLRNVVASNRKVPLTPIETTLEIAPGPATGPEAVENLRPYEIPGTQARIGFATSLPAFVYGDPPPAGVDPCSDTARWYMRCLDRLGTTVVMQDEANPGRWSAYQPGGWQPLEWMSSTWRAAADPSVSFTYNVTPHMVGNLADLAFDGQTAITQRGLAGGPGCHYVGNASWLAVDPEEYRVYAGPKTEFLALLPWAAPDGPREDLAAVSARLAPGSGDARENDYVEGAIVADLTFPADPARAGCRGA